MSKLMSVDVSIKDHSKLYEQALKKKTPELKLEEIRGLVRRDLPHAIIIGLILLITRK